MDSSREELERGFVLWTFWYVFVVNTMDYCCFICVAGPMGVGAIFISTLALSKLPKPNNPPGDQAELLAATLPTIVSFVVFGSIIIRKTIFTFAHESSRKY